MTSPAYELNLSDPDQLQRELDRLVDGELSPQRQQALLRHLDQVEDGWRRCALAFVESQVWRQEFDRLSGDEPAHPPATAPAAVSTSSGTPAEDGTHAASLAPWQRRVFTLMSMAASFVVAFLLGFAVHRNDSGDTQVVEHSQSPAEHGRTEHDPTEHGLAVAEHQSPAVPGITVPNSLATIPGPFGQSPSWGHVRLMVNDDGTWQPVNLPAIDGVDAEQWLSAQPSAVPEQWRQDLQRQGHTVQTQRQLVPLDLGDGRRLVVPVENVEVQYVGGHRYQ